MNETVRKLFPNASISFYNANPRLCAKEPKSDIRETLVDQAQGKAKSDARHSVRIIQHRVRLLDKDNLYASTKQIIDGLQRGHLIPGDSEKDIDLEVTQEKVDHFSEQRTEVKIHSL